MKARLQAPAYAGAEEQKEGKEPRMEKCIAFDSHKRYTWVEHQQANTGKTPGYRLERNEVYRDPRLNPRPEKGV
jgi:hypothetical protein